jgi:hypothetical protein
MRYWIYAANGKELGACEDAFNVSWNSGNFETTAAILVVEDGKRAEIHSLGNGFKVTVDIEPPAHSQALEKAKELDRAVNPEADQILRPGH